MARPWGKVIAFAMATTLLALITPPPANAGDLGQQVLDEVNFARTQPQAYALWLLAQPLSDWERQLSADNEDAQAYAEAVDFLLRQAPLPPLRAQEGLAAAASEQVASQGPRGLVGHESAGGEPFEARLRRHVARDTLLAEDIAYGPRTAADIVRELIIDRGVPDRGHRANIFHREVVSAGAACGEHSEFGSMCVIDFAGESVGAHAPATRLETAATAVASPARRLLGWF